MAKIGRNDPCPCGSGNKYKRCCGLKRQTTPTAATAPPSTETTLTAAVEEIIRAASAGQQKVRELGVFVLVSTAEGDAWLLEITQSDCVKLADGGKPCTVSIDETPHAIEVEWSHRFVVRRSAMEITGYRDKKKSTLAGFPAQQVGAAIKRIRRRIPPGLYRELHLDPEKGDNNSSSRGESA